MVLWSPALVLRWCGGIFGAALVAYLTHDAPKQLEQSLARRHERRERTTGVPITYTAQVKDHDYIVLQEGDATLEVPASGHTLQVIVTGAAPAPVLLTGLRAEVLSRVSGDGDLARHAAEVPVRRFQVLLDEDPARVRPLTASDFPYQIKRDETEVFNLLISTETGDVRWVLWLDWSTEGRTGSLRVDLRGQPFRTVARYGAHS
jgi:hypothetical protein